MTEIKWNFRIYRAGALAAIGCLSTIDLSFPAIQLEQLGAEYAPCTIQVRNSAGEIYEKDWE